MRQRFLPGAVRTPHLLLKEGDQRRRRALGASVRGVEQLDAQLAVVLVQARPDQVTGQHAVPSAPVAPPGPVLVDGVAHDEFEEHGLAVADLAQHAAQPLNVLARPGRAAQHDGDLGLGHVHALVQHLRRDERLVGPRLKALQDLLALGGLGLVGDGRDQVAARNG